MKEYLGALRKKISAEDRHLILWPAILSLVSPFARLHVMLGVAIIIVLYLAATLPLIPVNNATGLRERMAAAFGKLVSKGWEDTLLSLFPSILLVVFARQHPYTILYAAAVMLTVCVLVARPQQGDKPISHANKVRVSVAYVRLLIETIIVMSAVLWWDPVSKVLTSDTKEKPYVNIADTTLSRVSCDSVRQIVTNSTIQNREVTEWSWGFTKEVSVHTTAVAVQSDTIYNLSPLVIGSLHCGDTVVVAKQSVPYYDRNASLARIHRKYIEAGKWAVKEETIYRNQSPQVQDWELGDIFTKKRAQWHHTIRDNKYTLSLLHEGKVDTLNSREDAQGLLEAKCKDEATKKNDFSYAEFNACKSNGSITKIKVPREEFCGYAKVHLNWKRGSLSSQPYGCWGANPNWYYERDPLGIRGWR